MAKILGEKRHITDNVFEYEKRLQSPYNRFIDRTPTYVTYYHINSVESTVNEGYQDTEEMIGENSSLRFQKIEDFPLYGIQQIVIDINEDDQGLDGHYEGEAIFLPHTVKPVPNDYFIINHLRDSYLFRITAIEFDNIHPDNFYKATFYLDGVDMEKIVNLNKQVMDKFVCITENIGTEDQCIIQADRYDKIQELQLMYEDMSSTYMAIFYNEKYNCILGEKPCGKKLYDPFLIEFVNKWELFNSKDRINTYVLSQEVMDNRFSIKYEKSVWRFIERKDIKLLNNFYYYIYPGLDMKYTTFALWHDETIFVSDISLTYNSDEKCDTVFNDQFVSAVKNNEEVEHEYAKVLKSYIRGDKLDVYSIPTDLNDALLTLNANLDFFFVTPMLLYIIKDIIKNEMKDKSFYEMSGLEVV